MSAVDNRVSKRVRNEFKRRTLHCCNILVYSGNVKNFVDNDYTVLTFANSFRQIQQTIAFSSVSLNVFTEQSDWLEKLICSFGPKKKPGAAIAALIADDLPRITKEQNDSLIEEIACEEFPMQ
ncbi:46532_t:CDS:2 [Gigaspora margarita]|uniref:46532_t:CDS:1 n=1 Tax=Gigaspora margarita TaxID=4874 RepID=A0ABM8VW84_GIGMA|nr:46532_t:CDS:2 [Gigaspora margarita]